MGWRRPFFPGRGERAREEGGVLTVWDCGERECGLCVGAQIGWIDAPLLAGEMG